MLMETDTWGRNALFAACERNMNALVRKGSRSCPKAVRAVDKANDLKHSFSRDDRTMAKQTRVLLRVRCGLCPFRAKCKAPLTTT